MLKTILSISGRPGLFRLVSHGKNMLIVESLADKKKVPAYAKDKVISLGDIAIYTNDSEVPLHQVLNNILKKENGAKASIKTSATPDELRDYMAEILPEFDHDRVYPSDIKKLIMWYNLLIDSGFKDFTPLEELAAKAQEKQNNTEKAEEAEENNTQEEQADTNEEA